MPLDPLTPVTHVQPDLPLSADVAVPIMGLGVLVLGVVAYDVYRVYGDRVAPETDSDNV